MWWCPCAIRVRSSADQRLGQRVGTEARLALAKPNRAKVAGHRALDELSDEVLGMARRGNSQRGGERSPSERRRRNTGRTWKPCGAARGAAQHIGASRLLLTAARGVVAACAARSALSRRSLAEVGGKAEYGGCRRRTTGPFRAATSWEHRTRRHWQLGLPRVLEANAEDTTAVCAARRLFERESGLQKGHIETYLATTART